MPTPGPKAVTDSVWFAVVVGDAVALDIWRGPTSAATDDIFYLTFDQMVGSTSGVFKIDNLAGTPAVALAYQDVDENTTRTRGQVAVDYAGNLIYSKIQTTSISYLTSQGQTETFIHSIQ
jgi:hypothetical protein